MIFLYKNGKMKISIYIFLTLFALVVAACGPSDEEKASAKLRQAEASLERSDTITALLLLDSIPGLFPKAEYAVNASRNLKKDIQFNLLHQKEAQLDTLILKITELEKPFSKEKTEFDRYAQYIHKRQNFEQIGRAHV